MICKNCGTLVEEGVTFCTNCGTAMDATTEEMLPTEEVTTEAPVQDPGKVMGIVGMALGIASAVLALCTFCCNPCYSLTALSIFLGAAGVVPSILGMNKSKAVGLKNTMALVGLITGIAGIAIAVVFLTVAVLISIFSYGLNFFTVLMEEMLYGY
jgi:hypothetical protein